MLGRIMMVRKQVYIQPEQEAFLKARARELGITEAELIRRGIEHLTRTPVESGFDQAAHERLKELIGSRLALPATTRSSERWRRDELYEDRLGQLRG
jgi:hypothetical protein